MNKKIVFSSGWAAFLAFVVLASAPEAFAARSGKDGYSGSSMACLVGNDFYAVHFSAIQPGRREGERTDFTKYCQEIPSVGTTYLSIDLLDRDTRKTPITLRVVEEEFNEDDGRPPKELRTLIETPAKIYPNGTADIHTNITQPGHYALIATIGEDAVSEDDHLRIPFTVALEGTASVNWLGRITGAIVLLFFGTLGIIAFRTWRAYRPRKSDVPEGIPVEAKAEAR